MWSVYVLILYRRKRRQGEKVNEPKAKKRKTKHVESNPTALAMRLVVFILGVLPQAVKLFGMRGISFTQACAAIFLLCSMFSAAAIACETSPRVANLRKEVEAILDEDRENNTRELCRERGRVLGSLANAVATVWIWYLIASDACWMGEAYGDLIELVKLISYVSSYVFGTQWLACWAFRWKPPIPRIPGSFSGWTLAIMIFCSFFPGPRSRREFIHKSSSVTAALQRAGVFIFAAACCTLSVAAVLKRFALYVSGELSEESSQPASPPVEMTAILPEARLTKLTSEVTESQGKHEFILLSMCGQSKSQQAIGKRFLAFSHGTVIQKTGTLSPSDVEVAENKKPLWDLYEVREVSSVQSIRWPLQPLDQFPGQLVQCYQDFRTGRWHTAHADGEKDQTARMTNVDMPLMSGALPDLSPSATDDLSERPVPRRPRPDLGDPIWGAFKTIDSGWNFVLSLPIDVRWIAFSIFNLLTASLYYLVIFDGAGTVNPRWTQAFG